MKVHEALNNSSGVGGIQTKDEKRTLESKGTGFQGQIKRIESENYEQRIKDLADSILLQGEKLGKKVDIRELKIYKKLISEFLDEAVGHSFKFSKQSLLDRRGRHKVYATIKKINTELEGLTQDVLNREKDNIKVLRRIEDIRGLILDITL